jgi:sugar O-acyltransferase (sialic acid O-acetyltransferase NeuD family)
MPTDALLLLGAGGHGKVVLEAYCCGHPGAAVEIRDDDAATAGRRLLGVTVSAPIGELAGESRACHVAIGDNPTRRRLAARVLAARTQLAPVVHPRACVSSQAVIGEGAFIAACAVVAPDARVEAGAIVNHGAIVDHDCVVGAWSHVAPRAVLGGGVRIGEECLIGSGAVVLPRVAVGDRAVIGSGAVVTRDVAPGAKVVGVPARIRDDER